MNWARALCQLLSKGTTYRFAKEDRAHFADIIQAGTDEHPYYTNSSQLPVAYTGGPFEALVMQDDLQRKYMGGTVLHLYVGEKISSAQACKNLVRLPLVRAWRWRAARRINLTYRSRWLGQARFFVKYRRLVRFAP